MKPISWVFATTAALATTLAAQASPAADTPSRAESPNGWIKELTDPAKRGTLHDGFQFVRGDSGKWSDEPRLLHAPPLAQKPPKTSLDDWIDQLLERPRAAAGSGDDQWLLLRTRQLDDNDRLWVERIERRGNQFTVTLSEAIWQGKYFKTFTFYDVFGVNLGKLEPGKYEAVWIIQPRAFKQFTGDGRPANYVNNRQIDNWPKDDQPVEKKPVTLSVTFTVAEGSR